ncbi:MAG: hypothetical protein HY961_01210 [Ignavibacteriae bacterium]|nr:hypothetical protein [Ignavibacteriota bacterium]
MTYCQNYHLLKRIFNQCDEVTRIPDSSVEMIHSSFVSESQRLLPGATSYSCDAHRLVFDGEDSLEDTGLPTHIRELSLADAHFTANREFRYTIFKPADGRKADRVILLLHGLNERHWYKYLPWAQKLVELTGHAVCLFPIAFHMNRAPEEWSSAKRMNLVAQERRSTYPSIAQSSFANAAISTRLHNRPQRFFWSGVQTYNDVERLIGCFHSGGHPHVAQHARVNFFAYSIGSFLAQIMLMANRSGSLADAKLFIFCGGPTFDRMYPVSKYIMDSEAMIALYAFYVEHLDNEFKRDKRLSHYFAQGHASGEYFRAMLSIRKLKAMREQRLQELSSNIMAVALKRDEVIQPSEVVNTLKGDSRTIPIPVHVMDFPYDHSHVMPFPYQESIAAEVDRGFNQVFAMAAQHLTAC